MKTESGTSKAVKIATWSIVIAVFAGILALSSMAHISEGNGLATRLFIAAVAAVIALQVVPGALLLAGMFKGICSVVGRRELVIADRDARYVGQLADHFRKEGYRVATADSTEQLLTTVTRMQAPVLLLGSAFNPKVPAPELIHLFKKCNRNLHVILVSEEMSLAQTRLVREEGIFFQAMKPVTPADTEELGQVVACAFEHQASVHGRPVKVQQNRAQAPQPSGRRLSARGYLARALPLAACLALALVAANYSAVSRSFSELFRGAGLLTWIFLGLCATVITYQILPVFRIKLGLGKLFASQQEKESGRGSR